MYETTRKSLMRYVTDKILAIGGGLTYVDFDSHGDLDKLPNNDCVGLHQFGFTDHDQFFDTVFGITLSTYDDPNLLRMTHTMDQLYEGLRPLTNLTIYNPTTAAVIGVLTLFKGTTIHPIDRAERRASVSVQASGRVLLQQP